VFGGIVEIEYTDNPALLQSRSH